MSSKINKSLSVIAFFLCGAFFFMCKESGSEKPAANAYSPAPKQAAAVNEMGQNVFNVNCATCHGQNGEGDGPTAVGFNPRNFKKDKFKNGSDTAGIRKTLNEGIRGTQMVAWKGVLSDAQIDAVIEYVQYLVKN